MQQLASKVVFNTTIEGPFTPIGIQNIFLGLLYNENGTETDSAPGSA